MNVTQTIEAIHFDPTDECRVVQVMDHIVMLLLLLETLSGFYF